MDNERRPTVSRRHALVAGAVGSAVWVAPSVVGLSRVAAAAPSNPYQLIYSEDFEGAIGGPNAGWSNISTANPTPTRTILGRFTNNTVNLTVDLPTHQCVRICFDLYVNDSWDGTDATFGGPDRFGFSIDGTTIWNEAYTTTNAPVGGTIIEGPAQMWFNMNNPYWDDRVIQYCVEIVHTDPTIVFSFFGSGLQGVNDESWGLDNVEVFAA